MAFDKFELTNEFQYTMKTGEFDITLDLHDTKNLQVRDTKNGLEVWCTGIECWRCNAVTDITYHHAIPKHLRPFKNVIVPMCEPCHEEINAADFLGLRSFATKIKYGMLELGEQLSEFLKTFTLSKKKYHAPPVIKENTIADVIKMKGKKK